MIEDTVETQKIKKIKEILEQIKPAVLNHGGDIELVKFEHGIVYVKMYGACVGCPASMFTLKLGVEEALKQQIPDVVEVVSVDD